MRFFITTISQSDASDLVRSFAWSVSVPTRCSCCENSSTGDPGSRIRATRKTSGFRARDAAPKCKHKSRDHG